MATDDPHAIHSEYDPPVELRPLNLAEQVVAQLRRRARRRAIRRRLSVVPTAANGWVADVGDDVGKRNPNAQPHIPDFGHPRGDNDWMKNAACIGRSDLFFSKSVNDRDEAKRICMRCPVLLDCHDYARRVGPSFGVWAGGNEARLYVAGRPAQADEDRQQAAKAEPAPASAQIGAWADQPVDMWQRRGNQRPSRPTRTPTGNVGTPPDNRRRIGS